MPAGAPGGRINPIQENDPMHGNDAGRESSTPPGREGQRALQALERMGKPQPKPAGSALQAAADIPERQTAEASGSATGFVGTLARDALDAADGANAAGETRTGRLNLPMAREIKPRPKTPAEIAGLGKKSDTPKEKKEKEPGHAAGGKAAGVMLLLAAVLAAAGVWAAGAICYMSQGAPADVSRVRYPLLEWQGGGYTAMSHGMAWGLLVCLPAAGVLAVLSMRAGGKKG